MSDAQLYDETFTINAVNDKVYDRVSRISGKSADGDTEMTLDIHSELYPLKAADRIQMVLASSLDLEGKKEDRGWTEMQRSGEQTLADLYEYVMRGKIYRFEEGSGENIKVFISFGGLLLYLNGPFRKLTGLRIDYVYLLVKK